MDPGHRKAYNVTGQQSKVRRIFYVTSGNRIGGNSAVSICTYRTLYSVQNLTLFFWYRYFYRLIFILVLTTTIGLLVTALTALPLFLFSLYLSCQSFGISYFLSVSLIVSVLPFFFNDVTFVLRL